MDRERGRGTTRDEQKDHSIHGMDSRTRSTIFKILVWLVFTLDLLLNLSDSFERRMKAVPQVVFSLYRNERMFFTP